MLTYHLCDNKSLWSQYTLFYLQHRQEIVPGYTVESVLRDIVYYMDHGRAILALDEEQQVVAITCCFIGLPEQQFQDKRIALLHNSFVLNPYQNSRTFIRGLQYMVEEIGNASPKVEEVRIHAVESKPYLNQMYNKIAHKLRTYRVGAMVLNEYKTSYESLSQYCKKFRL